MNKKPNAHLFASDLAARIPDLALDSVVNRETLVFNLLVQYGIIGSEKPETYQIVSKERFEQAWREYLDKLRK